jgi:geranylgeranylglycerol-phosphate geranylgeranyltransferase
MSSRSLSRLLWAGLRFAGDAVRGRANLGLPRTRFASALLRSLRPHYFALPASASLAGSAAALAPEPGWPIAAATAAAGMGWGVGQLLNDLMDTEADAVDAPLRAAVRGLLPDGPTMLVAMGLGVAVAALTAAVHPRACWLALCAACLLLAYGPAKRVPLLGNLAHAALIATAAAIGRVAATPRAALLDAVSDAWSVCVLAGVWAAVYLQANYEKDRLGDARAGCRTLAHVAGLPLSAILRALGATAVGGWACHAGLLKTSVALWAMGGAVALVLLSAGCVLHHPTEQTARESYRFAIHAATIGMLSLCTSLLGDAATVAAMVASVLLTERAFCRSPNTA